MPSTDQERQALADGFAAILADGTIGSRQRAIALGGLFWRNQSTILAALRSAPTPTETPGAADGGDGIPDESSDDAMDLVDRIEAAFQADGALSYAPDGMPCLTWAGRQAIGRLLEGEDEPEVERQASPSGGDGGAEAMRERAEAFARLVHAGRVDRAGRPDTGHLGRVAARARAHADALGLPVADAERCGVVGWLHDAIEDCGEDAETLEAAGFDPETVWAVDLLSRNGAAWGGEEPYYADWIDWIARHGKLLPIIVKLADLEDNLDPARGASLPDSLRRRYEKARAVLLAARPLPKDQAPRQGDGR